MSSYDLSAWAIYLTGVLLTPPVYRKTANVTACVFAKHRSGVALSESTKSSTASQTRTGEQAW